MKLQAFLFASLLFALSGCGDTVGPDRTQDLSLRIPAAGTQSATSVEVLVNPRSAVIQVGNSMLFMTMVRDYSNSCVTARTQLEVFPAVTWSVSDTTIAVVTAGGVVTGLQAGETTVAASCPVGVGRGYGTAVLTVVEREGSALVTDDYVWSFALEGRGLATLNDVWGSSATDVFAVGSSELWECCGTIMHYDGAGWGYMPVPDSVFDLRGVWGSSPTDVFAVGVASGPGGVILHYDGVVWSTMLTPTDVGLEAVWGNSATDVFAVGSHGIILHYDGSRWTTVRDATGVEDCLTDIWGTSDGDLFAVGNDVLHSSGGVWSEMRAPPVDWLMGVWGSSSSDVFAVGQAGVIIHYDGVAWSRMDAPERGGYLLGIWGNSGQDVIAVGDRKWSYDGTSWRVLAGMTGQSLNDVWTTPDRAFIVGSGPTIIEGIRRSDH